MLKQYDHYQKLFLQNKKNLELFVDQQMIHDNYESYSSDECESQFQVFTQQSIILKYKDQLIELPVSLFELDSFQDLFSISDFTPEEITFLYELLPPVNEDDKQLIFEQITQSKQIFHFTPPMQIFQQQLKSGYFTDNRVKCDQLDKIIGLNLINEYYSQLYEHLDRDSQRIQNALKRRNKLRVNMKAPSISSDSQRDLDLQYSSQLEDEEYLTQSSQSQSPMIVQQLQIQPQAQFIPSAQSLFVLNPIVPLPPLTSTSITTTQMTLALLQAKKQVKQQQKINQNMAESNVVNGQTNKEWLEFYWKQEKDRYSNPLNPYTFTCIDGSKVTVGPVAKKLISGVSQKPRQHELLKNERPTYVTILSLVRDASARLPKGFGTRADIVNLVKDSQYINESLQEEKMSSIISGALDRLHQSTDPCVKYDQEKKIWIYLHHDRDSSYPDWQMSTPAKHNSGKKKNIQNNSHQNENEF